jgi:transcriptional regulator with XRE-family HTH domain
MLTSKKSIGWEGVKLGPMTKTFGELVRGSRESQDIKSYQLAEMIGRRPSLISRIENGDYKETPPPDMIAGLSKALGIPQYRLLRAIGYDVGPASADGLADDPEMDELVSLLRRLKPGPTERWWLRDLLVSMGRAPTRAEESE